MNKIEDKEPPFLTPCVDGENPVGTPLIIIENHAPETQALIHLHQLFKNPIFKNIF